MDLDHDNSPWSYTYAASYTLGPLAGAIFGGVMYNLLDYYGGKINEIVVEVEELDDAQSLATRTPDPLSGNVSPSKASVVSKRYEKDVEMSEKVTPTH